MSSIPEVVQFYLLNNQPAANADYLGDKRDGAGWDPYEVWLRLVKQPRDRRNSDIPRR